MESKPDPCQCVLSPNEACNAQDKGWFCTLEPDHSGAHIACATHAHRLHTWYTCGGCGKTIDRETWENNGHVCLECDNE